MSCSLSETISIIVPVYNVERYLRKCVDSLMCQTYENIEIILVDDGSTDSSGDICDEYERVDGRIVVIHKTNGGLSDSRNTALKEAKGKYVGFVDSDDWFHPDMFAKLINACKRGNAEIAVCGMIRAYKDKEEAFVPRTNACLSRTEAITELFKGEMFGDQACTKLYERELFNGVEYPKGRSFEDIFTTYKLFFKADNVAVIEDALYYYRQRGGSITKASFNQGKKDFYLAIQCIQEYVCEYGNEEWNKLLKMREYGAKVWTLLDLFTDKRQFLKMKDYAKELFQDIRDNGRGILEESRYGSCRMMIKLSKLGFHVTYCFFRLFYLIKKRNWAQSYFE